MPAKMIDKRLFPQIAANCTWDSDSESNPGNRLFEIASSQFNLIVDRECINASLVSKNNEKKTQQRAGEPGTGLLSAFGEHVVQVKQIQTVSERAGHKLREVSAPVH